MEAEESIATLLTLGESLREASAIVERKLLAARGRLTIKCGCGHEHRIDELTALYTHRYVEPFSCTGGDYWAAAEMQIVCPLDGHRERLLFRTNYDKIGNFETDPEMRFRTYFASAFKESFSLHEARDYARFSSEWRNNYYVSDNQDYYGIRPDVG